jgi:chromosome partitioning protein
LLIRSGGVGKTTTALNLGVELKNLGKKVLLIDCDPQGDLTASLGYTSLLDETNFTLASNLNEIINATFIDPKQGIIHHEKEGIDFIPADIDLENVEVSLVNVMSREYILKQYLNKISRDYEYILIDCRPSLGMLTINALATADSVIIPVQAHYLPLKGMTGLVQTINKVKGQINANLKIDGVLLTLADMNTNMGKTVSETLKETYGNKMRIFKTIIPQGVKAIESTAKGESLSIYDKTSKPAMAYKLLAKEVLEDVKEQNRNKRATECR